MAVTSSLQCKEAGRRPPSFSRPQHSLELPIIFPFLPWGKSAAPRIPGLCREYSAEALSNPSDLPLPSYKNIQYATSWQEGYCS